MTSPDPLERPRVVVTGVGAVSAFGWGAEPLRRGLAAGRSRIGRPERFDTQGHRTHVAGEVPDPPDELVAAQPRWQGLSQADRFAIGAALEAIRSSGLGPDRESLGVYFGSSTAGMLEGEVFYGRSLGVLPGRPALRLLASQQINGPGDAVARALAADGPVYTVSSACSSGALAIGEALYALRSGEIDVAVAGGADSLCALTYSGFNSLRAVDERPCRPFQGDRAGLSLGEGAAALVLETESRARQRGVEPLAVLAGFGASCDSHHMTAPHPEGEGAALAVSRALADAGVSADAVTWINAHGTGTPLNDQAEWHALRRVFGERAGRLPTTSVKGAIGHLLGTAGAIEAVATVLALRAAEIPPTAGEGPADAAIPIDLVRRTPRAAPRGAAALSLSLAFGGANAALLLVDGAGPGAAE